MKKIYLVLTTFLIIISLGCKPSFMISEKNYQENSFQVATADNNYSLDMATVYDALYKSKVLNLGGILDTQFVRDFIDSLVLDSMMGFEANQVKLDEYYNDYRVYKLRYFDYLVRQLIKQKVYDKVDSDSLEIVEYYYANEDLFAIEEQIDLYHIALTDLTLLNSKDSLRFRKLSKEDLEVELFRYADSIKSLITSPDKFPEIAQRFSEDVVAAKSGGHLGWTKRNTYPPPFDSVAFELRKGELGGPYRDVNGVHIIMAMEYYPAGLFPLNENLYIAAQKTLNTTKTNKIGNAFIDSLLADYEVIINPEIMDKNLYLVDGKIWGAIINGIDTIDCNEARTLELNYRNDNKVQNTTPKMKTAMFKQIGEKYVLVQAARDFGLENDSVITQYRNTLHHKYTRAVVARNRVDIKWEPSDSLLRKYYEDNISDFEVDKPIKVQHIIVDDSLFGEFLRDQAMSGIDFMELAQKYYPGEKSIRTELADLGFIGENDVSKEFYQAALLTPLGEVSHPVKTEFGYHIIKLLEFKKAQTFDEAKRLIIPILKKEYREKSTQIFMDRLFSKYNVQSVGTLYQVHLKPKSLRE